MSIQNAIMIEGRRAFQVAAAGQSEPLEPGVYDVWAAADAYIKVGDVANDVTAQTGYKIPGGGGIVSVRVMKLNSRIGATAEISVHRTE